MSKEEVVEHEEGVAEESEVRTSPNPDAEGSADSGGAEGEVEEGGGVEEEGGGEEEASGAGEGGGDAEEGGEGESGSDGAQEKSGEEEGAKEEEGGGAGDGEEEGGGKEEEGVEEGGGEGDGGEGEGGGEASEESKEGEEEGGGEGGEGGEGGGEGEGGEGEGGEGEEEGEKEGDGGSEGREGEAGGGGAVVGVAGAVGETEEERKARLEQVAKVYGYKTEAETLVLGVWRRVEEYRRGPFEAGESALRTYWESWSRYTQSAEARNKAVFEYVSAISGVFAASAARMAAASRLMAVDPHAKGGAAVGEAGLGPEATSWGRLRRQLGGWAEGAGAGFSNMAEETDKAVLERVLAPMVREYAQAAREVRKTGEALVRQREDADRAATAAFLNLNAALSRTTGAGAAGAGGGSKKATLEAAAQLFDVSAEEDAWLHELALSRLFRAQLLGRRAFLHGMGKLFESFREAEKSRSKALGSAVELMMETWGAAPGAKGEAAVAEARALDTHKDFVRIVEEEARAAFTAGGGVLDGSGGGGGKGRNFLRTAGTAPFDVPSPLGSALVVRWGRAEMRSGSLFKSWKRVVLVFTLTGVLHVFDSADDLATSADAMDAHTPMGAKALGKELQKKKKKDDKKGGGEESGGGGDGGGGGGGDSSSPSSSSSSSSSSPVGLSSAWSGVFPHGSPFGGLKDLKDEAAKDLMRLASKKPLLSAALFAPEADPRIGPKAEADPNAFKVRCSTPGVLFRGECNATFRTPGPKELLQWLHSFHKVAVAAGFKDAVTVPGGTE